MHTISVQAAVLTIGSLFWDEGRAKWRADQLEVHRALRVRAPIRYGRRSKSGTYTMVFSNLDTDADTARAQLIPCRYPMSRPGDLFEEAELLWAAEMRSERISGVISADWGCVAILVNPRWADADVFLGEWKARFAESVTCHEATKVVSPDGILQFGWPSDEEANSADPHIILATANVPTLQHGSYAPAEVIANAWNTEKLTNAEYFFQNVRSKITTADDDAILALMSNEVRQHGETLMNR